MSALEKYAVPLGSKLLYTYFQPVRLLMVLVRNLQKVEMPVDSYNLYKKVLLKDLSS